MGVKTEIEKIIETEVLTIIKKWAKHYQLATNYNS